MVGDFRGDRAGERAWSCVTRVLRGDRRSKNEPCLDGDKVDRVGVRDRADLGVLLDMYGDLGEGGGK